MDSTILFRLLTQHELLAVMASELGNKGVEEMLSDLKMRRIEKLTLNVNITALYWGWAQPSLNGTRRHDTAISMQKHFWLAWSHVWTLIKIERFRDGEPVTIYAAHNIGHDGWCVLIADLNKLANLLRIQNLDYFPELKQYECQTGCYVECEDYVVPRLSIRGLTYSYFWHNVQLTGQRIISEREAHSILVNHEYKTKREALVQFYMIMGDPERGSYLIMGFIEDDWQHKASCRFSDDAPVLEVVREEMEVREFLMDLRPLLKNVDRCHVNYFLTSFVRINPVSWSDAQELVYGDLTLREVAFQRLYRSQLPLSYILQHFPPYLYIAIRHMQEFDEVRYPADASYR